MLRITIQEGQDQTAIKLEGRIVGPWVTELQRFWADRASHLPPRELLVDLRNVTYADAGGMLFLRGLQALNGLEIVANTPWTQYLAGQIAVESPDRKLSSS